MRASSVIGLAILSGCAAGPSDIRPVTLTQAQKDAYAPEVRRRVSVWFREAWHEAPPDTSGVELAFDTARVYEFDGVGECYFRAPDVVKIGATEWYDGCVPHEFGHYFLYVTGNSAWCNFEHDPKNWHEC